MQRPRATPFLDRYTDPLPIRSRGAYQLVSARREGEGRVIVLPGQSADLGRIEAAFAEVERVHGLIDSPMIPRVSWRAVHDGTPYLELACDALMDGEDMLRLIADAGRKLPYAESDGFIRSLRMALQAAHRSIDPRTGEGICLGRISLRNVLFNREGRWFLVGFGRNFPLEQDTGELDSATVFFAAQELSNGVAPSPMGDYVALLLFMRSFMSYTETLGPLRAILAGNVKLMDGELFRLLTWLELRVFAAPASLRASMEEAIEVADRVRALLGVIPNADGYAEIMRSLIDNAEQSPPLEGTAGPLGGDLPTLFIGDDYGWVAGPKGERHRLGRAAKLIVEALVARHASAGEPLGVTELLTLGWPGERPIAEAGANRVYVELNRLRRMGLRDLLERNTSGYRIVPGTRVVHERTSPLKKLVDKVSKRRR